MQQDFPSPNPSPAALVRFRVFCASPGDVADGREAVEQVVVELREVWRHRGIIVEFDGWEDEGPARGRPQDSINPLVNACHAFVGLLNARWGFPTSDWDSGFEEEYERARKRTHPHEGPDLCIIFKVPPDEGDQAHRVAAFRARLETSQEAYFRTAANAGELQHLVRRRLETLLWQHHQRNCVSPPSSVDWAAVLEHGPASQVREGVARLEAIRAAQETDPADAAAQLADLAAELRKVDVSLGRSAELLADEAADLFWRAGDRSRACGERIAVLRSLALRGSTAANAIAEKLGGWLHDELIPLATAWTAVVDWPEHPRRAERVFTRALALAPTPLVTVIDRHIWVGRLVEVFVWLNEVGKANDALRVLPELKDDSPLELVQLYCRRAELFSAEELEEALLEWDAIESWASRRASADPQAAATAHARHASWLIARGRLERAVAGFGRAGTLWAKVDGAAGEVAAQHFSARSASLILGELSDHHGPQAAALTSTLETPERVARQLIADGFEARVDGRGYDALRRFTLALHEHRRAGHFSGALHATRLLRELHEFAGESGVALDLAIDGGASDKHIRRLAHAASPDDVVESIRLDGASWSVRCSCIALGSAGRRLSPEQIAPLAPVILGLVGENVGSMRDRDLQVAVTTAIAAMIFGWPSTSHAQAIATLRGAARSGDFSVAEPAIKTLAFCTSAGDDHLDVMTDVALDPDSPARVSGYQLAGLHGGRPDIVGRLRDAGLKGNITALEALAFTDPPLIEAGEPVARYLAQLVEDRLDRPVGRNEDGSIIGFLRLEPWGVFARATQDIHLSDRLFTRYHLRDTASLWMRTGWSQVQMPVPVDARSENPCVFASLRKRSVPRPWSCE